MEGLSVNRDRKGRVTKMPARMKRIQSEMD